MSHKRTLSSLVFGGMNIAADIGGVAVPGVSAASGVLQSIHASIEQIDIHRDKCVSMSKKCDQLKVILDENNNTIADEEFKQALDELFPTLDKVSKTVAKWRFYPAWKLWLKSGDIDDKLSQFIEDIDLAMQTFDNRAKIINQKQHEKNGSILRSQTDMLEQVIALLNEGKNDAILDKARRHPQTMRLVMSDLGARVQEMGMHERAGRSHAPYVASPQSTTFDADPDFETSSRNSDEHHSEEYRQLKKVMQALLELGLPMEVDVLDGQVTRNKNGLIKNSPRAEVWKGTWFGRDVALKGYRSLKKSEDIKARFVQELKVWNGLHDEHIVQFYGITYDIGKTIFIVSDFQANGDVQSLLDAYKLKWKETGVAPPDFERAKLMRGAAQGLAYLHSCNIVHGNMKCSKIYISADNEAKLGDFGMSKLLEDIGEDVAAVTETASSRFSAPELFERNQVPEMATDIWQFASSVLHCFTNEVPYHDIKRNGQVVREIMDGKHPNRPANTELATRWITDDVWKLLVSCWAVNPADRSPMSQNRQAMIRIEKALERQKTKTT